MQATDFPRGVTVTPSFIFEVAALSPSENVLFILVATEQKYDVVNQC